MNQKPHETTRRQFLKGTAAGAVGVSLATLTPAQNAKAAIAETRGRAHYGIFQPGRIGKMKLKNRLCRSAAYMNTGSFDPQTEGEVTADTLRVHRAYAEGEVAMTMTGYMAIMDYGKKPTHVCASHDKFIPGLARMADAIHGVGNDCKLVAEIGHDGTSSAGFPGMAPVNLSPTGEIWPKRIGPSGFDWRGKRFGHILTEVEIDRFTSDMAQAARRLEEAGWDGCNIHGAHHYLINTFMSPYTNRRTDKYGGSMEKRLEIVRETVAKMRDTVRDDFAIIIKVNCDDGRTDDGTAEETDIHSFPRICKLLEASGVDAIDVSGDDPIRTGCNDASTQSYYQSYTAVTDVQIPMMLSGGNRNVELLEEIYQRQDGRVDFFNFARPLIRQPHLIKQWLDGGAPKSECINVSLCFRAMYQENPPRPARCIVLERERHTRAQADKAARAEAGAPLLGGFGV